MFDGADVIINLIGENIASKRWSEDWKEKIVTSRIQVEKTIVSVLEELKSFPFFHTSFSYRVLLILEKF